MIEMLAAMAILATVLAPLTAVMLGARSSATNLDSSFQAQLQAGLALDRLRRDVRCSSAITPVGAATAVVLTQPTGCSGGGGQVRWCTIGSGTRYKLYRTTGATCDSSGTLVADYLVSANAFTYTAPVAATSLGNLAVSLQVNVSPATASTLYKLADTIVLLNTTR